MFALTVMPENRPRLNPLPLVPGAMAGETAQGRGGIMGWQGFLGGIGLFLFGMMTMTEALRSLASGRMRRLLARFTTTALRGAISGALATAALQSSSAVVLTVIGFVGAGMLGFPQALGVIFGANVGSTATGWVVAVVGLKLHLGTLALPLLLAAVLAAMVTQGARRHWAMAAAGFALLFMGLDQMETATRGLETRLHPDLLPGEGWGGRAVLVLIGAAVTVVIQSSGAGVAAVLVLLGGGSVTLGQAAALVIGMDLGTTAKSLLASVGGSRDMRRTALAHVGYNLITDVLAFGLLPALPLVVWMAGGSETTALVAFHTGFNLLGAALLLPLAPRCAALIEGLVPDRTGALPEPLDRRLLALPDTAQDAARRAAERLAQLQCARLARGLAPGGARIAPEPGLAAATADLEDFLTRLPLAGAAAATRNRQAALLHLVDHLNRLDHRAAQTDRIAALGASPLFARPARVLGAALTRAAAAPAHPATAARLARLHRLIAGRSGRLRRALLLQEHVGKVSPQQVFDLTDAARWLERVLFHTERIVHYGAVAASAAPSREEAAASVIED